MASLLTNTHELLIGKCGTGGILEQLRLFRGCLARKGVDRISVILTLGWFYS